MSGWTEFLTTCVHDACLLEVQAEKPGNVSSTARFEDSTAADFFLSARLIAPILATAASQGTGSAVFNAVQQTMLHVGHNTNLGIVLLLAPMACVPRNASLPHGMESVLDALSPSDADDVYRAIQLATPGGLGTADFQDVAEAPTLDLRSCMQLAAHRDLIAAQYANGFHDVLEVGVPLLRQTQVWTSFRHCRIAWVALKFLAGYGDSLILRKCGSDLNDDVKTKAGEVLDAGWPHSEAGGRKFTELDSFLREDGHRRNPGTTADMIAAVLFAVLRDGQCRVSENRDLEFVDTIS